MPKAMIETLQPYDEQLLRWIHLGWANGLLDVVMPLLRNAYFWTPVYFFLLVWMLRSHGWKGLWWCVVFLLTFALCDQISATLIKPLVARLRPCNDESLSFLIRPLVKCGSGYSFPSSHATNHWGLSVYIIVTLRRFHRLVVPMAILWASLVSLAQLYVAVHYPSDILAGLVLGSIVGFITGIYFKLRDFEYPNFK